MKVRRSIGNAIFAVLLAKELVVSTEEKTFVDFFVSDSDSMYSFHNGALKGDGWFQKGVGVSCGSKNRAHNMTLLRETNRALHGIKDFHRPNPNPEQQRRFMAATILRSSGGGMDTADGSDELQVSV